MATLLEDFRIAQLEELCDQTNSMIRIYNEEHGKSLALIDCHILAVLDDLTGDEFRAAYEPLERILRRIYNNMSRLS